jgi:long-chain acyl-CoA synthetase
MLVYRGQTSSYAEVNAEANRIAHALIEVGVPSGGAVALFLPSRPVFVAAYYGAMKAGAAAAPLNAMFTPAEVAAMVDYLGASVLVTTSQMAASLAGARGGMPGLRHTLVWPADGQAAPAGTVDLAALATSMPDTEPVQLFGPNAVASVFHTSGTTGRPKGAAQTHANIVIGGRQMVTHSGWRLLAEHVACPLPLFNNFGSTAILNMAVTALATLTVIERWDTEEVLSALRGGANRLVGTPTMYIYLLQGHDPGVHGEIRLDPCIVGGQTTPVDVRVAFEKRFGTRLLNLYGATETHAVTLTPLHGRYPDGAVGQPIGQSTVRVVGEDGSEVAAGVVGELVLGGDTVCAGYWRDPERTAEGFGPDGWRSGDLGYRDEDGYIYVVDRKKDLIITGGANIYPAEIEAVLYEHPAVAIATVIGIPDPVKGEIPKAFVVIKPGVDVGESELLALVRRRLAAYKCPRAIEFVGKLPTSPVGKVLKRELRDRVLASLRHDGASPPAARDARVAGNRDTTSTPGATPGEF